MASIEVDQGVFQASGSRPGTQSGYRFGQLSHNSFFARHNPHPARVRHIKGLLDLPICAVNDDGYFASHQHSLNFPPNNYVEQKMKSNQGVPYNMPVSSINLARTQKFPLDTINGLQYFTGLQSQSVREKAVPKVGVVPVDIAWRDELKNLTLAAFMEGEQPPSMIPGQLVAQPPPPMTAVPATPRPPMYSPATGRLIPPPSRAMSRQASRRGRTTPGYHHITMEPDRETKIFSMLCQILQTEDISAVQAWLVAASEQEKATVLSIIQSALGMKESYFQLQPSGQARGATPKAPEHLPPIPQGGLVGADAAADRLTVHESPVLDAGHPMFGSNMPPDQEPFLQEQPPVPIFQGQMPDDVRPPTSAAFRPPSNAAGAVQAPVPVPEPSGPPVLRYTKTPDIGEKPCSATWNPTLATVKQ